jgi:hypothetical protein
MTSLASDHSICIECYMHWQLNWARNEWSMCIPRYPSGMLPKKMLGIISWLVMSHGFSWIHNYIACGLCREMTWSQSRNMISKTKSLCSRSYGTPTAFVLSTSSQMMSKWTATISYTKILSWLEQAIFPRRRAAHQKRPVVYIDNFSVHTSRASIS